MCGINGIITKSEYNLKDLEKMNSSIFHRGPDSNGSFFEVFQEYSIGMGMQRLSIIDLSTGSQPMFSADLSISIVFNGEIYNYIEIKEELRKRGYSFRTNSDTEVILLLYIDQGIESFSKLDGMYAFSIFDKKLNKVYIARDFFGEKPLYYYQNGTSFLWASELKSILSVLKSLPEINRYSLNLYLKLTYIPAPFTIFENIRKLESNNLMIIDCNTLSVSTKQISKINKKYFDLNFQQAKEHTFDLVYKSVLSRSVSDVPIGSFLSGGVDSSIVSFCLSQQKSTKVDTFSIGFENKLFDESAKSRLVAKLINSNHHEFVLRESDIKNFLSEVILNFDEPFADSSALASYYIAKCTKKYVKVALTGDGGDEIFAGYNKYYMSKLNQNYVSIIPRSIHSAILSFSKFSLNTSTDNRGLRFKLNRLLQSISYSNTFYPEIISLGFQDFSDREKYLLNDVFLRDPLDYHKKKVNNKFLSLKDFQEFDRIVSLEGDMLVKVDRTSMLASIECRAPFLNKELWTFTRDINDSFLMKGWNKKFLLKSAFEEYFPNAFFEKSKKGFGVPVGDWLRTNLKGELISFIDINFIKKQNIFDYNSVHSLVHNHIDGRIDNTFRVWTFYCFQKWYKFIYEAKIN